MALKQCHLTQPPPLKSLTLSDKSLTQNCTVGKAPVYLRIGLTVFSSEMHVSPNLSCRHALRVFPNAYFKSYSRSTQATAGSGVERGKYAETYCSILVTLVLCSLLRNICSRWLCHKLSHEDILFRYVTASYLHFVSFSYTVLYKFQNDTY